MAHITSRRQVSEMQKKKVEKVVNRKVMEQFIACLYQTSLLSGGEEERGAERGGEGTDRGGDGD